MSPLRTHKQNISPVNCMNTTKERCTSETRDESFYRETDGTKYIDLTDAFLFRMMKNKIIAAAICRVHPLLYCCNVLLHD
jgi:hypothetical protein